jgi:hypothetical protein
MKLICSQHRRVMVLDSGKVIHRQDGSPCPDKSLKLGIQTIKSFNTGIADESVTEEQYVAEGGTLHVDEYQER